MRGKHPRLVAVAGVATMALALGVPGTATAAHGSHAVPIKEAPFQAYATGTYLHAHLLQLGETRVVNANVAGSAAAVKSAKLGGLGQRADEMGRIVINPETPGSISYGRGVAVEAGLLEEVPSAEANLLSLAGVAKQEAPPTVGQPEIESIELDLDPLLYLDLARGVGSANWNSDDPCIYKAPEPPTRFALGPPPEHYEADFGYGLAQVADVELLDLAGQDEGEPGLEQPLLATNVTTGQGIKKRAVGWTTSQTYLAGQYSENGQLAGQDYGLASEARATLLPVTLFTGGPEGQTETTIEVLGPWRLVGNASGLPGTAWVHFGPEVEEPNQPILRISTRRIENGLLVEENNDILTVEQLVGDEGLRLHLPGIADISLGEGPRAIGSEDENPYPPATEAADGTKVSAAADILRIELLDSAEPPSIELAEVRLGHMEVEAEVPAGGLSCEQPPPPKFPPTGFDEAGDYSPLDLPLPVVDDEVPGAEEALRATGQDAAVDHESLQAESVARRQLPIRALGLFSAVAAIIVTSGAMLLRRRWSRS